jgi:hypothetical protein
MGLHSGTVRPHLSGSGDGGGRDDPGAGSQVGRMANTPLSGLPMQNTQTSRIRRGVSGGC